MDYKVLRYCVIAGAVLGAILAVLGGILIPIGNSIIDGTVRKEAVIVEGTIAYDNWVSAGAAVYRQFWLFDVLNSEDIIANGSKPVVAQRGPYTYKTRFLPKENITFHSNDTVEFMLPAGAIFEPSMSVGSEEDVFTVLNLAVAGSYPVLPHAMLDLFMRLSNSSLFQRRNVKELLWGYPDPMLKTDLGVFHPYNGTYDGPYNVFTGKDDISKVSRIDRWQREPTVSFWNDTYCNMINGTDGSSFAPFLDKREPLYFFSSDICRSVSAEYVSTENLKGIEVYRYMLPDKTLAAPSENPDNMCYCTDSPVNQNCSLAGVLDVTTCRGIPVFISLPHFLHGSESLVQALDGLSPSEEEHSTFLDVDPITGFTLNFAKRLQMNMMYGPSTVIKDLLKVKDYTVFPVLWLNETASLDDETANMFKAQLVTPMKTLEIVQITLLAIGCILFVICTICAVIVPWKAKEDLNKTF